MPSALGFDFGLQKTGVAVGQTTTGTAEALETINARGDALFDRIASLIGEWQPDVLVVGLPLGGDGEEDSPMCAAARRFGNRLHGRYGLPVHFVDERLTSDAAARTLREIHGPGKKLNAKKRNIRDAIAARMILCSWLNSETS